MATLTCGVCGQPVDTSQLLCSCGASTAHARTPQTARFDRVGGDDDARDVDQVGDDGSDPTTGAGDQAEADGTRPPEQRTCPDADCGAPVPADATTCPYCRTPLDTEPAAPTSDVASEPAGAATSPLPGALADRFRVIEQLPATGAEADLFVVEQGSGGPVEVLKLYRRGVDVDHAVLDRLARADIAHVVEVRDHGRVAGRAFELLEYVEAGDLRGFQERHGPAIDPDLARTVLQELADALEHLHELGLRHGDIKPGNILVRTGDPLDLVLADFGLAAIAEATLVFDGDVRRSQYYAAPEQIGQAQGQPADVWALGVVVMELLLGHHPFDDVAEGTIAYLLTSQSWPVSPDLVDDERWRRFFRGTLHRDPMRRWTASQVQDWLAGLELPEVAEPVGGGTTEPFEFEGSRYTGTAALAHALLSAWEPGTRRVQHGAVRNWIRAQQLDPLLESWFDDLQASDWDRHGMLLRAALRMNPELPPVYRDVALSMDGLSALCSTALARPAGQDAEIVASILEQDAVQAVAELTGSAEHQRIAEGLGAGRARVATLLRQAADDDLDVDIDAVEPRAHIRLLQLLADGQERDRVAADLRRRPPRDLPPWYRSLLREDVTTADIVVADVLRSVVHERADERRQAREAAELQARATGGGLEGLLARRSRIAVGLIAAGAAFVQPWLVFGLLLTYAAVSKYGALLRRRLSAAAQPETGRRTVGSTIDASLRWALSLLPRAVVDLVAVVLMGALWVAVVLVVTGIGHNMLPAPQIGLEQLLRRMTLPALAFQAAYRLLGPRAEVAPFPLAGRLGRMLRLAPLTLLTAIWAGGGVAVYVGWTLGDGRHLAQIEPLALDAFEDARDWLDGLGDDARPAEQVQDEPGPDEPPQESDTAPSWQVSGATALNVRAEPDLDATVLDTVNEGESLIGTGRVEEVGEIPWIEVELPDGRLGWASGRYLEEAD